MLPFPFVVSVFLCCLFGLAPAVAFAIGAPP
jgi:hypothetical protein